YQATYSSSALAKALSKEDAHVHRGPGALKILLGSGDPPGVDACGSLKGKEHAMERGPSSSAHGPDRGLKLTKILGTLLDTSPPYTHSLLRHPPYARDRNGGQRERAGWGGDGVDEAPTLVAKRRNVFDEVEMDLGNLGSVRVGKKREDASTVLRDRAAVAAPKASILRHVKAISDSEDEELTTQYVPVYDSENEGGAVKIAGGREQSDSGSESGRAGEGEPGKAPEVGMTLELTYITDPALFARDAQTRRPRPNPPFPPS
ncbi:hypothetical protein DXG01_008348, partial [Tephrocybe rancida]